MVLSKIWADLSNMAVNDLFEASFIFGALLFMIVLMLKLLKLFAPKGFFEFENIGRLLRKFVSFIGRMIVYVVDLPLRIIKAAAFAKAVREEKRYKRVKAEARKLVSEMPKERVEVRTIDAYAYCYDCDIHYNKKLPECPNCFAMSLAEGDAKAIFSVLKGVREFRYLSFDREQDLIKLICEKMTGDTVDDFGKKE